MYFHYVGREPLSCIMSVLGSLYVVSIFSIVCWARHVGRPLSGLICFFSVLVLCFLWLYIFFLFARRISPLWTMYLFYYYFISVVYSYSEFISASAWLVTTGTIKRAYGQWLVYGEFNTLGFISSPRLAYKFQGRYKYLLSSIKKKS